MPGVTVQPARGGGWSERPVTGDQATAGQRGLTAGGSSLTGAGWETAPASLAIIRPREVCMGRLGPQK